MLSDRRLLVVRLFRHVFRLLVCNALVAVDTSLIVALRYFVHLGCTIFLLFSIHPLEAVAVATFTRIGLFSCDPIRA